MSAYMAIEMAHIGSLQWRRGRERERRRKEKEVEKLRSRMGVKRWSLG